jgi:predicted house-cleaning noncanonical NTP pyrophosphatase (MazG superfamily)
MSTKLVRDRIPEIVAADGENYPTATFDDMAFTYALRAKLVEETDELIHASTADDRLEEAADVLEVLIATIRLDGFDVFDLVAAREIKKVQRGAFNDRIAMTFPDEPT